MNTKEMVNRCVDEAGMGSVLFSLVKIVEEEVSDRPEKYLRQLALDLNTAYNNYIDNAILTGKI